MHESPRAMNGRRGGIYSRQPRRHLQARRHSVPLPRRGGARAQRGGGCGERRRRHVYGGGQRRAGCAGTSVGWWRGWWRARCRLPSQRRLGPAPPADTSPLGAPRLLVASVAPPSPRVRLLSQSNGKVIQWEKENRRPTPNNNQHWTASLHNGPYTQNATTLQMQKLQAHTTAPREGGLCSYGRHKSQALQAQQQ